MPSETLNHIPRKRFGQHFLHDVNIQTRLIKAIDPQPSQTVVEIGPGLGALTRLLLRCIPHIYAVEIDTDLAMRLTQEFPPTQLSLYIEDALKFSLMSLQDKAPLRLVGNLPYNISTPLLFHFLKNAPLIQDMHFMLQKEVVDRLKASPNSKDYGRLSIMVQYACDVQALFHVPPSAFSPPPKVQSAVVRLTPRPFPVICHNEPFLAMVVQKAFQQRRKMLGNALKGVISPEGFKKAEISPLQRAETLSVEQFVALANNGILPVLH